MDVKQPTAIQLFKEYFDKRGIYADLRDENHIALRTYDEMSKVRPINSYWRRGFGWCAHLPFHDIEGNPIEYYGARILDMSNRASFNDQLGLQSSKFIVPPGPSRAYFPVNNPQISKEIRCVVTESAVKAIVAAHLGFFAVGLNGCWGFRSRHTTDRLLPDLRDIPWRSFKDVVFCPDSDWQTNPRVSSAASEFYSEMRALHRVDVNHLQLPSDPEGAKWGLDDFYVEHGREASIALLSGAPITPEHNDYLRAMHALNERVVYIRDADLFADVYSNMLVKEKHFHNLFAAEKFTDSDDNERPATRAWIGWEHRREAQSVIYRPGVALEQCEDQGLYNMWRIGEIDPLQGSIEVHRKFLEQAIPDVAERNWVRQWIGHVVQRPEIKMNTALVLYSAEQGTGKTMLAEAVSLMLGAKNTARVSMEVVRSSFNASFAGKQLVVVNETLASDKGSAGSFMDKLKTMITEDTIQMHGKGKEAFEIENHMNFILTTNHIGALKIDPSDRRFAIIELGSQFRNGVAAEAWGEECWQWHRENLPALLYHYGEEVSLDGFRSGAPAIMTVAKQQMAEAGYSEMELLVMQLLDPSTRGDTLASLGLKPDVQWVEAKSVVQVAFPGERNERSLTTRLGSAFKKFGVESRQFKVATPVATKVVRCYPVTQNADISKGVSDYLSGSSSKVAT